MKVDAYNQEINKGDLVVTYDFYSAVVTGETAKRVVLSFFIKSTNVLDSSYAAAHKVMVIKSKETMENIFNKRPDLRKIYNITNKL